MGLRVLEKVLVKNTFDLSSILQRTADVNSSTNEGHVSTTLSTVNSKTGMKRGVFT